MKALVQSAYGGPDVMGLQDVDRPTPGPGEILIRVRAAGLNPVDFKTREGKLRLVQRYRLPIVMGNELAGVVEACGDRVKRFVPGDRVFARVAKERLGAFADFAAVDEAFVAEMPDDLDFTAAAGVPLAGLTALQALRDELKLKPGSRVFIPGGAGGVGTFAIPIAKWLGAQVTTTASPRGRALVERLGADCVIDYTIERFEERIGDMDGVFDLVGGETLVRAFGVVKPGRKVVSIAEMPEPQTALKDLGRGYGLAALFWLASFRLRRLARKHDAHYRFLFMHPSGAELAELARLIKDGVIEPVVDRVFRFAEIGEAFAYLEAGHAKGKVVVQMSEP
ncbi:alcohol dehydrogenase, zinc-containing [Fulvimarina pelagi HTCC2506]|uniref:Alcohol dehydrogenase, zinc-containing n=1 Tax=Fulvimarina pelagi HTCC2506 TaxID=314231 RepID=Q0G5N7_9HYPH|nr:NADP-dependent oxidoreductase [Fulvimarina pelagi]EAU43027.1 alcohol dehydrogenase, zinc-containing [Fulvimarina pelagi HTCC2506]